MSIEQEMLDLEDMLMHVASNQPTRAQLEQDEVAAEAARKHFIEFLIGGAQVMAKTLQRAGVKGDYFHPIDNTEDGGLGYVLRERTVYGSLSAPNEIPFGANSYAEELYRHRPESRKLVVMQPGKLAIVGFCGQRDRIVNSNPLPLRWLNESAIQTMADAEGLKAEAQNDMKTAVEKYARGRE